MRRHLFLASLVLAVACGGSTDSSDLDSSHPSGAGSGGSAGQAGGGAGQSAGGASQGGSAGSGGASAGSGGSAGDGSGNAPGSAGSGGSGNAPGSGGSGGSAGDGSGNAPGSAGSAGSGAGNAPGSGGAGGSAGSGSGNAPGSGGSAGSAGAASCAPPSDPTRAALCVSFAPEAIDFLPDDPQLDGKGLMYLAAYDTPLPDNGPGEQDDVKPLAVAIYPQPATPTPAPVPIDQVPTLRLDNLPTTVYLRAFFFDNQESLNQKQIAWGVWLGGLELSGGLKEGLPLNKLALPASTGTPMLMPLTALRRLDVTVNLSKNVKPLDDASGPFQWFAFKNSAVAKGEPPFGLSAQNCLSLEAEPVGPVVRGFLVGAGPYFIVGGLNDFNTQDPTNIGTIYNLEAKNGAISIPQKDKITLNPKAYQHTHTIELDLVAPGSPNQTKPPPYTCP